jgi:regulator of protease activity HflC (stomatin/prohibitin superfamily)
MLLEEAISNIDRINAILNQNLSQTAYNWGIQVDKIEIQSVELPPTVMDAMHKRRAAAEEKMAQVQRAEAQKLTIEALEEAGSKLTDPTLHYLYLQSLQKIAEGKSSKIIFPLELSRLASNISARLSVPYSEAQSKVVERYQELAKEGEKPTSIIEELKRELGYKEEKPAKKKKGFEFD